MLEIIVQNLQFIQAMSRQKVHLRPLAIEKHIRKTVSIETCPTAVVSIGKIVLWLFQWSSTFCFQCKMYKVGCFIVWSQCSYSLTCEIHPKVKDPMFLLCVPKSFIRSCAQRPQQNDFYIKQSCFSVFILYTMNSYFYINSQNCT